MLTKLFLPQNNWCWYKDFITIMDCMCNKYGESEDLLKRQEEEKAKIISFYDAIDQKPQTEAQAFHIDV